MKKSQVKMIIIMIIKRLLEKTKTGELSKMVIVGGQEMNNKKYRLTVMGRNYKLSL